MVHSHYIQPVDLVEKPNKIFKVAGSLFKSLSFGCLSCVPPTDNKDSLGKYKVNHYVFNAEKKKMKNKISDDMMNVRIEDFERFIEAELLDDISIASDWSNTSLDQYFS